MISLWHDARETEAEQARIRDALGRQDLAMRLLFTVAPSDRALAGWGRGEVLLPLRSPRPRR